MIPRAPRLICLVTLASVWACSSSDSSSDGRPTGPAYSQRAGAGGLGTGAGAIGGAGPAGGAATAGGSTGTTIPPGFGCDISGCQASAGSAGASAGAPAAGQGGTISGGGGQKPAGAAGAPGGEAGQGPIAGAAGKAGSPQAGGGTAFGGAGAGGTVQAGAGGNTVQAGAAGNTVQAGAAGGPVAGSGGVGGAASSGGTGAAGGTGPAGGATSSYPTPTAYWPLDVVDGTALAESATIYGAMVGDVSAVPGLSGNAMRIGALHSYLWVPPTVWTQTLPDAGVSMWIKPEEDWDQFHGHKFFWRGNLLLSRFGSNLTFAVGQDTVTVTTTMLKDHWYHIVASYQTGTSITLSIQDLMSAVPVTGSMVAGSAGAVVGGTGPLSVFLVDAGAFHAGAIDDVAFFDRALSAGDAADLFALGSSGASPVCPGCTSQLSPVHAWRFEESSYDRATSEAVGGLPSATVGYSDAASGVVGGGMHVSEIVASGITYQPGAGVHVGSFPQLHPTEFTLSAWIKPDRQLGPTDTQMAWFSSTQNLPNRGFWFGFDEGLAFTLGDGLKSTMPRQLQQMPMMGGLWHHVAATWDGEQMALYLDGTLAGSVQPGITYAPGDAPLVLCGTNESAIGRPVFPGTCDEMALFSQALTPAEVGALYARGLGAQPVY